MYGTMLSALPWPVVFSPCLRLPGGICQLETVADSISTGTHTIRNKCIAEKGSKGELTNQGRPRVDVGQGSRRPVAIGSLLGPSRGYQPMKPSHVLMDLCVRDVQVRNRGGTIISAKKPLAGHELPSLIDSMLLLTVLVLVLLLYQYGVLTLAHPRPLPRLTSCQTD